MSDDSIHSGPDGIHSGPGSERRRHERIDVCLPARLTLVGYTVAGELSNIAPGGVCFVTEDAHLRVAAGNFVFVDFEGRRGDAVVPIRRAVRVTRVERPDDDQDPKRLVGLEFEELLTLSGLSFPSPDA